MRACFQTEGMTILQHGQMVHAAFEDLIHRMTCGESLYEWRLPKWLLETPWSFFEERLHNPETIRLYQVYHDCGKPYCLTIDENGKRHFPNHTQISSETWLRHFPEFPYISSLIAKDMWFHTISSEDLPKFAADPDAITLMLTALCEIHANASMFGGLESTSFKIKFKHIERRGRQALDMMKGL
jgi:hypothetical protein